MSVEACAEKVRLGDPDRYATALVAPPELRGRLLVLYAFNLEIARAPWASAEPMIAQMRLQFWIDTIDAIKDGKRPSTHEVAGPLADLVQVADLPLADLRAMVQARRIDIDREPFQDMAALSAYTQATAGNLMWLAARALGVDKERQEMVVKFGGGAGVATLLQATPELAARGHVVLPDQSHSALLRVVSAAQDDMHKARRNRRMLPKTSLAAMLVGWQADGLLRRAMKSPQAVLDGTLEISEFAKRAGLFWRAVSRRW